MTDTHLTAPTRLVEVDGDRFAYRRWGNGTAEQPPLFLLRHFRSGMDHWHPLMTDGLAAGREVILHHGRGVASSSGGPRTRIELMADDAAAVVRALGLRNPMSKFTLTFRNVDRGFKILSAKDGKEAFLAALHDEDLVISGDFVEVLWFQGFTAFLQPGK